MSTELTRDQQRMAEHLRDQEFVLQRLQAFAEGRLFMWSHPVERQDSAGCVHTLAAGQWLRVDHASALFVAHARYKIVEQRWRRPTDEDAKRRPECRVRLKDDSQWTQATLIYVDKSPANFFIIQNGEWYWANYCEILDEESPNEIP